MADEHRRQQGLQRGDLGGGIADDYLASNGGGTTAYGAGRYYIAFLGTPSTTSAWQLQYGGHHYALNVTYNGIYVSATPSFLGWSRLRWRFITRRAMRAAFGEGGVPSPNPTGLEAVSEALAG